ncbi:MAG: 5-(carboxyamino)imidazole ribonucleotide synthase [Terriglobia bacterium]
MRVGVLGAGQLGQMMALAGYPLGFRLRFYDHAPDAPAAQVAECVIGDFEDREALSRFAEPLDVVTYEFENVPAHAAYDLAGRVPCLLPPPRALEIAQDRYEQKKFFHALDIPVPAFTPIDSLEQLQRGVERAGVPAVLKTRRWGYDGKGQFILEAPEDATSAWKAMQGSALILEGFVRFDRELSLIAVRGRNGETAFYPLTENHHRKGILRWSLAPAQPVSANLQHLAESYASKIFSALNYAGVLTIEFFYAGGNLLANEMATRVHNSGHWTIEGAATSQFENHLRAICGFPLGSVEARGSSAMVNFIGTVPDLTAVLGMPGAHLHLYGKQPRPGRKLGHATFCAPRSEDLAGPLEALQELTSERAT